MEGKGINIVTRIDEQTRRDGMGERREGKETERKKREEKRKEEKRRDEKR